MEFKFDPEHRLSWGYFRCDTCKSKFYDLAIPTHYEECPFGQDGDSHLVYHFGPNEVKAIKASGRTKRGRLTRKVLETQFPELLE